MTLIMLGIEACREAADLYHTASGLKALTVETRAFGVLWVGLLLIALGYAGVYGLAKSRR